MFFLTVPNCHFNRASLLRGRMSYVCSEGRALDFLPPFCDTSSRTWLMEVLLRAGSFIGWYALVAHVAKQVWPDSQSANRTTKGNLGNLY